MIPRPLSQLQEMRSWCLLVKDMIEIVGGVRPRQHPQTRGWVRHFSLLYTGSKHTQIGYTQRRLSYPHHQLLARTYWYISFGMEMPSEFCFSF